MSAEMAANIGQLPALVCGGLFGFFFGLMWLGPWIADKAIQRDLYAWRLHRAPSLRAAQHQESLTATLLIFFFLFRRPLRPVIFGKRVILRGESLENLAAALEAPAETGKQTKRLKVLLAQCRQRLQKMFRMTYDLRPNSRDDPHPKAKP